MSALASPSSPPSGGSVLRSLLRRASISLNGLIPIDHNFTLTTVYVLSFKEILAV